ncbi:MAG: RNA-binding S4 domain-containing protein [Firmicutes bacterium]|nr:RNA-binding S4 domain-containing protein [Bacillota bacterium]
MRIDKFLKNSRLIKRRTVAKEACEQERITINDKIAKPGTEVKEGDVIRIQFGNSSVTARIVKLLDSCRKEDAQTMYEIIE